MTAEQYADKVIETARANGMTAREMAARIDDLPEAHLHCQIKAIDAARLIALKTVAL